MSAGHLAEGPQRRNSFRRAGDYWHTHTLAYDHLLIALGGVTNFFGMPALQKRALTMKSLADAVTLRNRLIANLEQADADCFAAYREALLTVVVAGGGFAGMETIAAINDFLREALRFYPNLEEDQLRLVLVHPGAIILPELGEKRGAYAQKKLAERGVEIRVGTRVTGVSDQGVELSDGSCLPTATLVWTAGTTANPLLAALPCALDRGRLRVNECLEVPEWPGVWAVGDSAAIPDGKDGTYPPTAQHALRGGAAFATQGQLAAIGRRAGVANVFGMQFSGFLAWWLWRAVYLSKLPRLEKRVRVALDWTLDLFFSKDIVQFLPAPAPSAEPNRG